MSASVSVSEMSHLVVRPPRCSSSPFFFPHLPCDAPSSPYSFRAHPYFCETCYCRRIEATSTFHLSIDPRSQSHLPGFVTRLALACSSCLVLRNITPSLFSTLIFGLFHQTSFLSFPCVPTFFFFPSLAQPSGTVCDGCPCALSCRASPPNSVPLSAQTEFQTRRSSFCR